MSMATPMLVDPSSSINPIGQPGVPKFRAADGEDLPAAADPIQGMLSPIFHRDVGAEDESRTVREVTTRSDVGTAVKVKAPA